MKLSLSQLYFERNNQWLLKNISFELHAGELLHIRGANGSGKSTLLRIIAGYIEPTMGNVCWNDKNIYQESENYSQAFHYIGHQNGIKSSLTVRENLQLFSALAHKKITLVQLNALLKKMRLEHIADLSAHHLSSGQLRRLALTRILLYPASLWLLDEPSTALDSEGQELFSQLINQHLHTGGMVIVTAHQTLPKTNIKILQLGEQYG